ncbi:tellurite resistance TerB C-terminal domain-containing protein [Myroides guanonis]|uniref:TM2 domain-containing protein n=1 Tax=Myroides guanonis TaxID=1150112 RepID=A0A1I3TZX3_9FLAO|nr:tellurite resistance TerB C-terminal domain-containing protein [Myroides guanonis]SFJ76834.1 TM2 domain-containing protein [Myroides guanonis]
MKNQYTAAALAIFLGIFGIHKFYLNRPIQGVIYLLLFWTFIPALVGFFEGIVYAVMSEKGFNSRYNKRLTVPPQQNQIIIEKASKRESNISNIIFQPTPQPSIKVNNIPAWNIRYVYSYNDLKSASNEALMFYKKFKEDFLKEKYISLGENHLSYAFVLLYDLEIEFLNNKDYRRLANLYDNLGLNYPKVRSYANKILKKHRGGIKEVEPDIHVSEKEKLALDFSSYSIDVVKEPVFYSQERNVYDEDYWKVGSRRQKKFQLKDEQVEILNQLGYYGNNVFNTNEFIQRELYHLYSNSILKLSETYLSQGISLEDRVNEYFYLIIKQQFGYRKGSGNYNYALEQNTSEFYNRLFRITENRLRELYQNKRKLNVDDFYVNNKTKELYDTLKEDFINAVDYQMEYCKYPDSDTEVELNRMNTTRWKSNFDQINKNFKNTSEYKTSIDTLAELNKENPSVENIFYEAVKYVAKRDKVLALEYYLKYIEADLKSTTFNDKAMNKSTLKILFQNQEQLDRFNEIVSTYLNNKDITQALTELPSIYELKRKKIQLDLSQIEDVKVQLNNTVELLNEYLEEEEESIEELDTSVLEKLSAKPKGVSLYKDILGLTEIESNILIKISQYNFEISREEVEEYLSNQGLFVDSFISNLNEKIFDLLDDNLIEDDEDNLTIYEPYYKTILK